MNIIKTDISPGLQDVEKELETATPDKFGDLVASDSIFGLRNGSTNTARNGDTTALVIRDRASGWVNGYPAKGKTHNDVRAAVQDFTGSDKIQRWYSDGALELHSVCRELGIRHDKSDPNRSETDGAVERASRTVI